MSSIVKSVGEHIRDWRTRRRMSQLDLALEAEISTRHLSFMETGRAQPSREMVLHLSDQLEIPLRERNVILVAAGFAPVFPERSLEAPELAAARRAVEVILKAHEPYPALVVDLRWNLVAANAAIVICNACENHASLNIAAMGSIFRYCPLMYSKPAGLFIHALAATTRIVRDGVGIAVHGSTAMGKNDGECAALADGGADIDASTDIEHNTVHQRESQARPLDILIDFVVNAEKLVEQFFDIFFGDADTGVVDFDGGCFWIAAHINADRPV